MCAYSICVTTFLSWFFYTQVESALLNAIVVTPLSYVPGSRIDKYLGNLNFFLIRETSSLREVGGLGSFVQWFICEIYSIVRSHVSALGGNAIVSYFMSEFVVMHSVHKNQVSVSRDCIPYNFRLFTLVFALQAFLSTFLPTPNLKIAENLSFWPKF